MKEQKANQIAKRSSVKCTFCKQMKIFEFSKSGILTAAENLHQFKVQYEGYKGQFGVFCDGFYCVSKEKKVCSVLKDPTNVGITIVGDIAHCIGCGDTDYCLRCHDFYWLKQECWKFNDWGFDVLCVQCLMNIYQINMKCFCFFCWDHSAHSIKIMTLSLMVQTVLPRGAMETNTHFMND